MTRVSAVCSQQCPFHRSAIVDLSGSGLFGANPPRQPFTRETRRRRTPNYTGTLERGFGCCCWSIIAHLSSSQSSVVVRSTDGVAWSRHAAAPRNNAHPSVLSRLRRRRLLGRSPLLSFY